MMAGGMGDLEGLFSWLGAHAPLAIAFSGGLDSRFLAFAADRAGAPFVLFHFGGPHVGHAATRDAKDWAQARGYPLEVIPVNVLEVPQVAQNSRDRCYWCKRSLFLALRARAEGAVCDGTNASDLEQERPGLRALRELGVFSPLALSGFAKGAIRARGAALGLDNAAQKARPCLLTRFAYDMPVTPRALALMERLEAVAPVALAPFCARAIPDFRFRMAGDGRLEFHVEPFCEKEMLAGFAGALRAHVARATAHEAHAPDAGAMRVRVMESLSGYFDRKQGNG